MIFALACVCAASCSLYRQSEAVSHDDTPGLETVNLPSWREFFADPMLQALIDTALCNNTDLSVAQLRIMQAEESLKASKLAIFPGISFSPSAGIGPLSDSRKATYDLPLSIEWNPGAPGSLFAKRHQMEAKRLQAQDYSNYVKSVMISDLATAYCYIQMLDEQNSIIKSTIDLMSGALRIQEELLRNGKGNYSSVAQMENLMLDARNDITRNEAEILELERSICLMLCKPYRHIDRSANPALGYNHPFVDGIPMGMLYNRPDVRAAEKDVEVAFYVSSEARSALFPSISINVLAGWPGILESLLSAVQPIFANGVLKARSNISEIDQKAAELIYTQTLLQAANEVSQSLSDYDLSCKLGEVYERQCTVLEKSYNSIEELMKSGKANYLEILKAQEKLLSARMDRCENIYHANKAIIALYLALGGSAT